MAEEIVDVAFSKKKGDPYIKIGTPEYDDIVIKRLLKEKDIEYKEIASLLGLLTDEGLDKLQRLKGKFPPYTEYTIKQIYVLHGYTW